MKRTVPFKDFRQTCKESHFWLQEAPFPWGAPEEPTEFSTEFAW